MRFLIEVHEDGVTIHLDQEKMMIPSLAIPYVLNALAAAHVQHIDQDRLQYEPASLH